MARPMWYSRATISRFSRPVSVSSTAADCPASPINGRTWVLSRRTSYPATVAEPSSGSSNVVRIRTSVVLPAPLGPSNPSTVPRSTSRLTPSSARTSPNDLWTSRTTTIAALPLRPSAIRCGSPLRLDQPNPGRNPAIVARALTRKRWVSYGFRGTIRPRPSALPAATFRYLEAARPLARTRTTTSPSRTSTGNIRARTRSS